MTQKEVCDRFLSHLPGKGNSLTCNGTIILSYNTAIAVWYYGNIIFNKTKYSSTTSRWQNYLLTRIEPRGYKIIEIDDVPQDTINLVTYYERQCKSPEMVYKTPFWS